MKKFLIIVLLLKNLIYAEEILPINKFFIEKPDVCRENEELWLNIEANLIYQLKKVKYFKIFHYKLNPIELPENIKLKFIVKDCKSPNNFIIKTSINNEKMGRTNFNIGNKYDLQNFPLQFVEYLKNIFPLTGIIIEVRANIIKANLGTKYDVKRGEQFLVIDNEDKVIGSSIVIDTDEYYSSLKITKNIAPIRENYKIIPFNFNGVNKLNSFKSELLKINPVFPYKLKGLESDKFKVTTSVTTNFVIISDSKETVFFNLENFYTEKFDAINFNTFLLAKFSYKNQYVGYTFTDFNLNTTHLRIWDLKNYKQYDILKDPLNNNYLLKTRRSTELKPVYIQSFAFSKSEDIFFFDDENKLINFSIQKNSFNEIPLENKIENVQNILISPNDENIIIEFEQSNTKNIFIKNLINGTENIIQNIKWWTMDRSGVNLFFSDEDNEISVYNLHTDNYNKLFVTEINNINQAKLSYSEQFIALIRENSCLDIYNLSANTYIKDIFRSGEIKYIKDFEWLPRYNFILIYGKLSDMDKNDKIDYRDINQLIMFDPEKRKIYKVLENIDDFNGVSCDGNFIFYTKNKELYIYQIPYEKILTK